MLDVDLKRLLQRLNPYCTQALHSAAGMCISQGHYEITPEHHLFQLLVEPGSDVPLILNHFDIDERGVRLGLEDQIRELRQGNPDKPVFSPLLLEWIQDAWMLSSVEYDYQSVRSGLLLQAFLARGTRHASAALTRIFRPIHRDELRTNFSQLVATSLEHGQTLAGTDSSSPSTEAGTAGAGTALGRYTINFTEQARQGRIDPVFGRDKEVRQMVDILARRRKNNPILVGEPGVGKTAVAEGFALRVAQGEVPEALRDVEILCLDLGLLQAGAGVRGEFENRLKAVISEVKSSPTPIVLFIDEAHTMIGAGGSQGGGDAANLLKPALARGELRTIAATTWKEYKKYFEKDAALSRRFELVQVPEPTPEQAIIMLRGLASKYAETHQVHIRDDAVVASVELSHRYLSSRKLPDKAVGLLDTCAARTRIGQSTVPPQLEGLRRQIEHLERELSANQRDLVSRVPGIEDRSAELELGLGDLRERTKDLEHRWTLEQQAALRVVELRRLLIQPERELSDDERRLLEGDLDDALRAMQEIQSQDILVCADVSPQTVAQIVSDWTGIPVGKMVRDKAHAVLQFETQLGERIKGQSHALAVIGERIRQAKSGLGDPDQPIGVFLLVGPSGVGKTETALGLADLLYGGERSVVAINMSEFQEKHTVSRLIGSPPGYVGYGEGGVLTEAVRQRPYCVVLLDEVEKADRDVMNLFYQVFDKGSLSDGEGREIDFRNTIILMTSNLATAEITQVIETGVPEDHDAFVSTIRPILSRYFKPALLARMTVVPYYPLTPDTLCDIAELKLTKVQRRLASTHGVALTWDPQVIAAISSRCTEVETGARNVDHIIRGTLLPRLSTELLTYLGAEEMPDDLHIRLDEQGGFQLALPGMDPGDPVDTLNVELVDADQGEAGPSSLEEGNVAPPLDGSTELPRTKQENDAVSLRPSSGGDQDEDRSVELDMVE